MLGSTGGCLSALLQIPRTADILISFSVSLRSKSPPSSTVMCTSYSTSSDNVSGVSPSSVWICHFSAGTSYKVPSVPYAYSFREPVSPEIPFIRIATIVFGCTFSIVIVFSHPSTSPRPPSAANFSWLNTLRIA